MTLTTYERGIDTYHGNSDPPKSLINWQQVKDSGIKHVWLKASQGSNFKDPKFQRDREECERVGFDTLSFYHWPDTTSILAQVKNYLEAVVEFKVGQGGMLDIENSPIIPDRDNLGFAQLVEKDHDIHMQGYVGVFYNGGYMWKDQSFFNGTRIRILPAYITYQNMLVLLKNHGGFEPTVWQHTSSAAIPGCVGRIDEDYIYDPASLIATCRQGAKPPIQVIYPTIPNHTQPGDLETMRYNYNGVQFDTNFLEIRHIESQKVADLVSNQIIDHDTMAALLAETGIKRLNASPFATPGYEDPDLHALWG